MVNLLPTQVFHVVRSSILVSLRPTRSDEPWRSLFISFHPPGTAHFFGSLVFTFKSSHPDLAQYERIPRPSNETNSASITDRTKNWFSQLCTTSTARSVARTIYPGMQITAVLLWQILQNFDSSWDLNNVCCYMPVWFLDKHYVISHNWSCAEVTRHVIQVFFVNGPMTSWETKMPSTFKQQKISASGHLFIRGTSCFPFDEVWSCFFSLRRNGPDGCESPCWLSWFGWEPSTWSLILLYYVLILWHI